MTIHLDDDIAERLRAYEKKTGLDVTEVANALLRAPAAQLLDDRDTLGRDLVELMQARRS